MDKGCKTFDIKLLQAVSDWQRGGDQRQNLRRGLVLKNACAHLPEQYRACVLCCFRQVALPKGGVWELIGENRLPEKISSWTLDIEISKTFKGGVPPKGHGYQGVVLCVRPSFCAVVVNLHELYQDPVFVEAMERNSDVITGYHDGAGRYGNSQCEVVLEVSSVSQEAIYSLGGHSSRFEELIIMAADIMFGRPATPAERETLLLDSEHLRSEAGPKWLTPEATRGVISRTQHEVMDRLSSKITATI